VVVYVVFLLLVYVYVYVVFFIRGALTRPSALRERERERERERNELWRELFRYKDRSTNYFNLIKI
jgi:hypothetical protein